MSTRTASLRLQTVEGEGLRFDVATGKVAFTLDSGPGVAHPSPMEVVLGAVGGCSAMDVISILRKQRQRVTGYEVEVTAERREEHPRAYTRIEVLHRVRGHGVSPAAVEEAIRLSDTKYCSVHAMLAPAVALSSRYEILPA
ncbi:MAG TPA: OsmC family protein [Candidatus Eisenbacteria bacterium]|jgi:putative redox protein